MAAHGLRPAARPWKQHRAAFKDEAAEHRMATGADFCDMPTSTLQAVCGEAMRGAGACIRGISPLSPACRGQNAAGGDDLDELAAPQRVYGCGRVVHVDEQPAGENGEGEVDWWRAGSARSDARGPQSKNGNVPADFGNNEVGGALFGPWEPVPAHILNTLSLPMSRGWANNNTLPPPNTMLPYQMRPTRMLRIVDRLQNALRSN